MAIIYSTIFILFLIFLLIFFHFQNKKKLLKKLREGWGKRSEDQIKIELAQRLVDIQNESSFENRYLLDDKTWCDLDMDELFKLINRTITPIGGQYLYSLLKIPVLENETLNKREKLINLFLEDQRVREKAQIKLKKLTNPNAGYLVYLLWKTLPEKPKFSVFFPILTRFACLYLGLVVLQLLPLWSLILIFTFNLEFKIYIKKYIYIMYYYLKVKMIYISFIL